MRVCTFRTQFMNMFCMKLSINDDLPHMTERERQRELNELIFEHFWLVLLALMCMCVCLCTVQCHNLYFLSFHLISRKNLKEIIHLKLFVVSHFVQIFGCVSFQ